MVKSLRVKHIKEKAKNLIVYMRAFFFEESVLFFQKVAKVATLSINTNTIGWAIKINWKT